MRFLNNLVGNQYLLALFLFALVFEIILLPFAIKQQKNSIKQAKLRPKEMAIRKKYAGRDDNVTKQKVQQEIQELYNKEGYSPFGGCLPLLIQLPILFALYDIVINPLRYICQFTEETIALLRDVVITFGHDIPVLTGNHTNTIKLMNAIDKVAAEYPGAFNNIEGFNPDIVFPKMTVFGIDFSAIPKDAFLSLSEFGWLLIVPVLTFVVYFLSSKINRKLMYQPTTADDAATGCSNKMMDWMMPVMSVAISFSVPAAVGIYWIYRCVLGVVKQFLIKLAMPLPVFTEEDYKAAEKEYGAKPEKASKSKSNGPKPGVRSLHHIDDEDFPDTAPAALARKKALEEAEAEEKKVEEKKPSLIAEAPIKDDTRLDKKSEKAEKEEEKTDSDVNDSENN
ncbi:MAG: membrane protein insertase YidC [Clostridia bacterium]|nr:membrane protein insertase YidC [Clostridia bacterium]